MGLGELINNPSGPLSRASSTSLPPISLLNIRARNKPSPRSPSKLNSEEENILVFHAGTTLQEDGRIKTNGGRVLACTALGDTLAKAVEKSQKTANSIKFDGKYFRKDIGKDLMKF